jgi:flavin reductase (DIM6/NTAB) family NADH-FMN oxidoreductase RutF
MSFDTRDFRNALGCFPTGVAVVTAGVGRTVSGITVNSFTSVSLDPPLVLWCLDRRSRRYRTFTTAGKFTISVLGCDHRPVSMRLAEPGGYKLDGLELVPAEDGPPALAGALAVLECTREAIHDGGDHAIIVGRVTRLACRKRGKPLIFFRGRYGRLAG